MKIVLSVLIVVFMQLNADEIQRIESMIQEISKLKNDYSLMQDKLDKCIAKKSKVCLDNHKTEDDNKFPKLKMKIYKSEVTK